MPRRYQVFAINPFSVSRCRDWHATSGAKSDPGDAKVLADGRQLSLTKITSALRRAGRQRRIDERATEIRDGLRQPQLEAPQVITEAFAVSAQGNLAVIGELTTQIDRLETELADRLEQHPDAALIRSLPGLGDGARRPGTGRVRG